MQNVSDLLNILFTDMEELVCTYQGCTEEVAGAVWKTPALEATEAEELLILHVEEVHAQQVTGAADGVVYLQRPTVRGGCSQAEFKLFLKKWRKFVRSSGETDEVLLKNQLLICPDDTLQ